MTAPDTAQTTRSNFDGSFSPYARVSRSLPRKARWDRVGGSWLRAFPSLRVLRTPGGSAAPSVAVVPVLPGQVVDERNPWWRRLAVRR